MTYVPVGGAEWHLVEGRAERDRESMATRYYRMNSLLAAEAVLRRLASEPGFYPSRPLGYAYRKVVRVDYADGLDPDPLVREADPGVRIVPKPERPGRGRRALDPAERV